MKGLIRRDESGNVLAQDPAALMEAWREAYRMTLLRPSNVDDRETFMGIAAALNEIAEEMPIIFPVHLRTKKMMEQFDVKLSNHIKLISQ